MSLQKMNRLKFEFKQIRFWNFPGEKSNMPNFSPGEMQQVRISPGERCHRCGILPRRNETYQPCDSCISPLERLAHVSFLPRRNSHTLDLSPRKIKQMFECSPVVGRPCLKFEFTAFEILTAGLRKCYYVSPGPPGKIRTCWISP